MGEGAHYDFDINFVYLFSIFFLHHCIGDPPKPQKGGMAFFQKKKGNNIDEVRGVSFSELSFRS